MINYQSHILSLLNIWKITTLISHYLILSKQLKLPPLLNTIWTNITPIFYYQKLSGHLCIINYYLNNSNCHEILSRQVQLPSQNCKIIPEQLCLPPHIINYFLHNYNSHFPLSNILWRIMIPPSHYQIWFEQYQLTPPIIEYFLKYLIVQYYRTILTSTSHHCIFSERLA